MVLSLLMTLVCNRSADEHSGGGGVWCGSVSFAAIKGHYTGTSLGVVSASLLGCGVDVLLIFLMNLWCAG